MFTGECHYLIYISECHYLIYTYISASVKRVDLKGQKQKETDSHYHCRATAIIHGSFD